ncbi:MAG: hypothetical protein ACPGQS_10320 [Bradymonadia bacterium]
MKLPELKFGYHSVHGLMTVNHLCFLILIGFISMLQTGCQEEGKEESRTQQETDEMIDSTVPNAHDFQSADQNMPEDSSSPINIIEASQQRPGTAETGYEVLVNDPYVSCGVPARIFDQFFGTAPEYAKLSGRNELNQNRRYYETAFVTASGVEVVGTNCLQCHAEYLDGEIFVGLGDTNFDYTRDTATAAEALKVLVQDDADELEIVTKWAQRVQTIAPYVKTKTIGVNPADSLTEVLLAHRDRETLEWSELPLLDLGAPHAIPVSVPPWWFMKKKHAMFYTGSGRGDHARFMMSASTLCTDTVEEAEAIDRTFPDVRAFIESIEPPTYPREIDESLALTGQTIFNETCSSCHGTYGDNESYPNIIVDVDFVGTDPLLSESAFNAKLEFFDWYNQSFYGELARAVPTNGYVAPPLDGVWATAPYFHNGSVPTLLGVIHPQTRPTFWSRDYTDYIIDEVNGGLVATTETAGHAGIVSAADRALVYDTTQLGYGNGGHRFGEMLSEDEVHALIEYLKTL